MRHNEKEIAFFRAVRAYDEPTIVEYYQNAKQKIVPQLWRKYRTAFFQKEAELYPLFKDAFFRVCEYYIHREDARIKNGRITSLKKMDFRALMFTVTDNMIKNEIKRHKKEQQEEGGMAYFMYGGIDTTHTPTEKAERLRSLRKAMRDLKPDCQRLIRLRWISEKSFRQIAEIFKSTEGSMRGRHKKCMDKLKGIMNPKGESPSKSDKR